MEKKKIEDEDIKWYHELVYRRKCAQIAALESEINQYEELLAAVEDLNADLVDCATYLKNTYIYASSGVSCVQFDADIGNISNKATSMENAIKSFTGVISNIKKEITKREEDIAGIKSTMWI